jgi:hypothetical protein
MPHNGQSREPIVKAIDLNSGAELQRYITNDARAAARHILGLDLAAIPGTVGWPAEKEHDGQDDARLGPDVERWLIGSDLDSVDGDCVHFVFLHIYIDTMRGLIADWKIVMDESLGVLFGWR